MLKKIKNILLVIVLSLILPIVVDAASFSVNFDKSENKVVYTIKYTPDSTPAETLKLKINVDPLDADLEYKLEKSGDFGNDKCSNFECDLITGQIKSETDIATFTITNPTSEEKKINLTFSGIPSTGTIKDENSSISLPPKKEATTTKPKSNNSNMTAIGLSVGALDKTFDSNVTDYTVTGIKDTINSVTLTPTCDNCTYTVTCPTGGCSITNSNRVMLQAGANNVSVVVTSEDGTSNKTYMFNIYRGDIVTSSPYLEELSIKDAVLSPTFNSLTNDYTAIVKYDVKKLEITTVAEDPTADIQIKGDTDLKVGENTVTVTVTSSDGQNKQVYTIVVTREEQKKKTTKKVATSKVKKKKNNTWLIILLSVLALAIIVVSFILIFRKKKKNKNGKNDKKNKKDKNKDNNDNNNNGDNDDYKDEEDLLENTIEKENTDALNILEETKRQMREEPKTDIDDALDDLMKTKKLELDDLDF